MIYVVPILSLRFMNKCTKKRVILSHQADERGMKPSFNNATKHSYNQTTWCLSFFTIFSQLLLYLRTWAVWGNEIFTDCGAQGDTHWACSGNDVTSEDNSTQAWEKPIPYWRTRADFNQMFMDDIRMRGTFELEWTKNCKDVRNVCKMCCCQ